ncbi:uncharacterized protein [Amphiura filiformis]|uniref:uncharacterized protein n=1 Tax=Amphiura filiformis TaxID=82378 RepID=UPI003B216C19
MSGRPTSHKSCCIPKCRLLGKHSDEDEDDKKISYHTFPFDETESLAWLKNICAADKSHIELFPNSRVCSRHFTDDNYVPNLPNGRIRLKPGAVPTVFEWTSLNADEIDNMDGTIMQGDDGNPAGFTVHVARRKPGDDESANEPTLVSRAIPGNLSSQQATGLDLTSRSNAFIALQSPPGLALATPQTNCRETNKYALPMEGVDGGDDDDDVSSRPEGMVPEEQCVNCEILETELSRASIELTNLQREKVLLHAKCAELEDEVQKIHVYCKQLKALNDHLQLVTAKDKEEKAQRLKEAEMKAKQEEQQSQQAIPSPQPSQTGSYTPLQIAAMVGKGRRKQSNPMKRPRENEPNSHMSNGDVNQPHPPDVAMTTDDAATSEQPAKIPALDNDASSNNLTQDHLQNCRRDSVGSIDASTQTTIEGTDISGMKDENDLLSGVLTDERRLHRTLFVKSILTTNENVKTFTGIPTKEGLEVLFEVLMDPEMMNLHWQARPGDTMMAAQKKAYLSINRRGMSSLSPFHDFLITLIRLNLGLKHVVLSSLFGCSTAKTSTVCRSWIEYMRECARIR